MLINSEFLLQLALANHYGVGAFNINTSDQAIAVAEAAHRTDSPVIVQFSKGARDYSNDIMLRKMMEALNEMYPHIPFVMHLDHGTSPQICVSAMDAGFKSVMMDGSLLDDGNTPSDFEYNVEVTKIVVEEAHRRGVTVEAELGCLGHLKTGTGDQEDGVGATDKLTTKQLLTDPVEASRFVSLTGCDSLAVAIGTSHGAFKFSEPPDGEVLVIDRVAEIAKACPGIPLVMHGSSSVPQELKERINAHGGKLKPSWGVPMEDIKRAIQMGVAKINVDTDGRLVMTAVIREIFEAQPEVFDPRKYMGPAREALADLIAEKMEAFGQAGRAPAIRELVARQS